MNLHPSKILDHLHPDATTVCIRTADGAPCGEISIEALKALVAREFVIGIGYEKKSVFRLRSIALTVGPDKAFGAIAESRQRVKDLFRSEASVTVVRSLANLPRHIKAHHKAHCNAFLGIRHNLLPVAISFQSNPDALTAAERCNSGRGAITVPLTTSA